MKYKLGNFETKRLDLNTIWSVFLRPKKMNDYGSKTLEMESKIVVSIRLIKFNQTCYALIASITLFHECLMQFVKKDLNKNVILLMQERSWELFVIQIVCSLRS